MVIWITQKNRQNQIGISENFVKLSFVESENDLTFIVSPIFFLFETTCLDISEFDAIHYIL
jgi:hypothetical protein